MSVPLLKRIAVLALGALVLSILGSFALTFAISGKILYSGDYQKHKASLRKQHAIPCKAPHPFIGNIDCEDAPVGSSIAAQEPLLRIPPLRGKGEHPVRVLILGGSLAAHLSDNTSRNSSSSPSVRFSGLDLDHKHVAQHILNKRFGTQRFEIHNAAIRGGKQPQQLFKLMYLLMLGERYDVVLNLDGYNEIALPLVENRPSGNHPLYPRAYTRLVQSVSSTADTSCIPAANANIDQLSYLPPVETWRLFAIQRCHIAAESPGHGSIDPIARISRFEPRSEEVFADHSVELWRQSSRAIARLATVYGFQYIHVLQPNQYHEGSKPLIELSVNHDNL
jgi:hypothetical protein